MVKAVLLLSGGLDSTLAGRLLLDMGVTVQAVNFVSPFCNCTPGSWSCSAARGAAEQLGIPVEVFTCGQEYLEVVKHPRFGRGSEMNPCLDCRIHMFSRARVVMEQNGADFVATGEVLGERPMSQRRDAMAKIERESGLTGRIIRPLCGKLMPPSLPEQQGLVDRDRMAAISGRSRKPQLAMAEALGLKDCPCPAGGCLLNDPEFAARFADLLEHAPDFDVADARLLRVGRHFRLPGGPKVVVGRNEGENEALERAARDGDALLAPRSVAGPSVLCRSADGEQDCRQAAGLLATYVKGGTETDVLLQRVGSAQEPVVLEAVPPVARSVSDPWRIGAQGKRKAGSAKE